jgi:hypothetical protein
MSVVLKPGTRLRSVTCDSEVVVVKAPADEVDVRCGGASMAPVGEDAARSEVAAPFDQGTLVGKRYVNDDDSLELLCTKAGSGSLSVGEAPLEVKGAKPLPSSD